jgi:hypothetical protein
MGMAIAAIRCQKSRHIGKVSIYLETGVVNEPKQLDCHGHERCTRSGCGSGVRTNKRHGFQLTEHAEPEHPVAAAAERQLVTEPIAIAEHDIAQHDVAEHGPEHSTAERSTTVGLDIAEHGAAAGRQREGRSQRSRLIRSFKSGGSAPSGGRAFLVPASHRCAI